MTAPAIVVETLDMVAIQAWYGGEPLDDRARRGGADRATPDEHETSHARLTAATRNGRSVADGAAPNSLFWRARTPPSAVDLAWSGWSAWRRRLGHGERMLGPRDDRRRRWAVLGPHRWIG